MPYLILAGLPKVVIVNHGTIAATDAFNAIEKDVGYRPMVLDALRKRCFVSMPSFHVRGRHSESAPHSCLSLNALRLSPDF